MKCPTCKKDFAGGVKAAYKLGIHEGENRLQITINCIKKTHRRLFNELLRLDRVLPLDSASIKMSRHEAEKLVTYLLKNKQTHHTNYYQAKKIKKLITSQIDKPAFDGLIKNSQR